MEHPILEWEPDHQLMTLTDHAANLPLATIVFTILKLAEVAMQIIQVDMSSKDEWTQLQNKNT